MRRLATLAAVSCMTVCMTVAFAPAPATAQHKTKAPAGVASAETGAHPKSSYYRRAPQVRGFVQRRGGYSFGRDDVTNTIGDERVRYDARNAYTDRLSPRFD
jgi:hypothetical protein